ncbi:MAG: LuxR family transcriptional regulator [Oscillatoriales cyanobacterium]|nr:MAG: LuxR family transcriptional regulator [Oscillatoriales cyanobacterium]TAD98057.1 MAG: LuxR family transcriptional regulator [Oscillatoriales cyanobacterium]TAE06336.1 MAG: LuxR family transcriptional regulator [Oscillatoriales cyanobacterium]TAF05155.1 MAG: LuxR family transcriptional regulator [Oscillatoriales cyanobacterium]TAF47099.1 MAG: LuxR family transcriptional regulator [Oscillatoriales cyanobacterium]
MTISLQLLFKEIHQVKDENDLRSQIVPAIGEYFATKRCGIFFFDQLLADRHLQKLLKVALSVEHNPVARYLVERHTPVHEGLVTSPKAWAIICPRPDHWHVMAGPIVDRAQLVGAVGCTREQSMPAFDTQNLADLSAICLHLSVWAATVREAKLCRRESQPQPLKSDRLTSRELQIAELVALGRTNAEIGREIWITENSVKQALKRIFRKLEVSSRAAMVAQLAATNLCALGGVLGRHSWHSPNQE